MSSSALNVTRTIASSGSARSTASPMTETTGVPRTRDQAHQPTSSASSQTRAGSGRRLVMALRRGAAGGAAAPPAYAITTNGDGSLTVNLDSDAGLVGVNRKLAAMGTNEHINFQMAQGPAAVRGPVNCVPSPQGASVSGPPVKVTVGPSDMNTETIAAGNTGAGTWHVAACWRANGADPTGLRYLG